MLMIKRIPIKVLEVVAPSPFTSNEVFIAAAVDQTCHLTWNVRPNEALALLFIKAEERVLDHKEYCAGSAMAEDFKNEILNMACG
ncbi:hypothetical protein ACLOJK_028601 [Asimina triloba]